MKFTSEKPESKAPIEPVYRVFLLRCWQEAEAEPGDPAAWRFRLVEPGSEKTGRGFVGLAALIAYLQRELERS